MKKLYNSTAMEEPMRALAGSRMSTEENHIREWIEGSLWNLEGMVKISGCVELSEEIQPVWIFDVLERERKETEAMINV